MRSLVAWPKDDNDSRDTLASAQVFGVDKIVWIYENTTEFNAKVHETGIEIGTSMADNAREAWLPKLSRTEAEVFVEKFTMRNIDHAHYAKH